MAAFDPVTAAMNLGSQLIDRLIPDPAAKAAAALALLQLQQSGELASLAATTDLAKGQLAVDQVEAASPATFTSGWRPFIGWVCGLGLACQFLVAPFVTWGSSVFGKTLVFPTLDMGTLLTLLLGMLGLGGMRTYEKVQGAAGVNTKGG